MSLSVTYNKAYLTRYVVDMQLGARGEWIEAILDTACSTTLVPLWFAKRYGVRLNCRGTIVVGGSSYKATLYLFENVVIGGFTISKLVAFAADYKGSIEDRILLGNNFLHNFIIELHRNESGRMKFEYKPWHLVRDKKHPCAMFFRTHDSNPLYPDALMVEDEGMS